MKLYTKYSIFLIFLILLFSGCDPISSYKTYIKNSSGNNLKVLLYSKKDLNPEQKPYDSILISKGNTELLKSSSQRTSVEVCTNSKDSIVAIVQDNTSLKVTKDLNLENNYQSNKSGNTLKGYTIKCETTITDADIVPK